MNTEVGASTNEASPSDSKHGYFSQFYYALCEDQSKKGYSNLVLHVAYGIYKAEKQKEIERLHAMLGRPPNRAELNHFVNIAISHIDYYTNSAVNEQTVFYKFVIDSLDAEQDKSIVDIVKKIEPQKYRTTIYLNIVSNFIWTVIVALLAWYGTFGDKIKELLRQLYAA